MSTTDKLNPVSKKQEAELRNDTPVVPATPTGKSTTARKSKFRVFLFAALLLAIVAVVAAYFFRWDYPYLSTEDAYVHGNQILLTPRVTGTVVAINADDTDLVQKGQPLVVLDDSDANVQLLQAEGALGDAMRKVCQYFVSVRQSKANVEARGIDLAKADDDYHRRKTAQSGTVSAEDITHARQSADGARQTLEATQEQLAASQAMVVDSDLAHHPLVLQAEANVLDADLALQRTTIKAPETGYIVRRNVQVGQRVTPGTALLAIVPLNQIWVDANYKEQELRNVRIGQPVALTSDFYGRSVKYKGRVVGLNPSTGAAFSLLPPDEGSGNWIKIIQRVPVRIVLEDQQLEGFPLRIGLSMRTVIDTRDRSGEKLTKVSTARAVYSTPIYSDEWSRANELMQSLVSTNLQALSSLADPPLSPPTYGQTQK